jgi:hypothetical protein
MPNTSTKPVESYPFFEFYIQDSGNVDNFTFPEIWGTGKTVKECEETIREFMKCGLATNAGIFTTFPWDIKLNQRLLVAYRKWGTGMRVQTITEGYDRFKKE